MIQKLTRVKAGVSEEVEKRLKRGRVVEALLKQPHSEPVPMEDQVITLYAFREGFFDGCPPDDVPPRLSKLISRLRNNKPELIEELVRVKELTGEITEVLDNELAGFGNSAV